jgi:hypothetical protein
MEEEASEEQSALPALVHQHDGNVILHLVDLPARFAGERLLFRLVIEFSFALGAAEDFEEFRFKHISPEFCSSLPEGPGETSQVHEWADLSLH